MFNKLDAIIVGAGLAGLVTAEQLAARGKEVLIIEKKNHIGGHCFDYLNESGIYIHLYGPHIFHTDSERVWDYLSRFTDWNYYEHKVLGEIDGQNVPIPFNLNSMKAVFSSSLFSSLEKKLIDVYGYNSRVSIMELRKAEDKDLKFLADYIYEKVFLNYTMKQWGMKSPEELDPSVLGRVPVIVSRDNRYFHNKYQAIPKKGYSSIFDKMIDNPKIHVLLNTEAHDIISIRDNSIYFDDSLYSGKLIYTGMVDELFNYEQGNLPYRSVDIKFQEYDMSYYQKVAVVNYPNDHDFTRSTEFKYFQDNHSTLTKKTTVCREYPVPFKKGINNPYYVIHTRENDHNHKIYAEKINNIEDLYIVGRLAEYKYYDMDQIVLSAMETAESL